MHFEQSIATYQLPMPLEERVRLEEEHALTKTYSCLARTSREPADVDDQGELLPAGTGWHVGLFALQNAKWLPQSTIATSLACSH